MSFDGKSDYSTQKITIEFIRVKSYEDDQSANLKVIGIENLENLRGKVISVLLILISNGFDSSHWNPVVFLRPPSWKFQRLPVCYQFRPISHDLVKVVPFDYPLLERLRIHSSLDC